MNSEFQVLRWGIPGWIFLMTITVFKMSLYKFKVSVFINSIGTGATITGVAALFVALGVPIGYIIYHIYFLVKWEFGRNRSYLAREGIKYFEGKIKDDTKADWALTEEYANRLMTIEVVKKKVEYKDLQRRFQVYSNRTSRVHGLGASLLGMLCGIFTFFALTLPEYKNYDWLYAIILLFPFTVAAVALYKNYTSQDASGFMQLNSIMKHIEEAEKKNDESKNTDDKNDEEDTET